MSEGAGSTGGGFGALGAGLIVVALGVAGFFGWQSTQNNSDAEADIAQEAEGEISGSDAEVSTETAAEGAEADMAEEMAEAEDAATDGAASESADTSEAAPEVDLAEVEIEGEEGASAALDVLVDDAATATGDEPVLDVVRIDPQGGTVIAGQAAANTLVRLMLDGEEVASDTADAGGNFVLFATLPPSDEARALSLEGVSEDGTPLAGLQTVMVSAIEAAPEAASDDAAVEVATTDTTADTSTETAPAQPTIVIADADGAQVVQRGEEAGPEVSQVSLDVISYGAEGEVLLSGRSVPNEQVQIYIDNEAIELVEVTSAGAWEASLTGIAPGNFTLRLDGLDAQGAVTSRLETPFQRAEPELVAAVAAQAAAAAEESATTTDLADATEDAMPDAAPAADAQADTAAEAVADVSAETADANAVAEAAETGVEDTAEAAAETVSAAGEDVAEEAEEAVTAVTEDTATDTAAEEATETAATDAAETTEGATAEPRARVVTVQAGFTLWAIAREELGDPIRYVQVFEANRDLIVDPDLIYPGQIFLIPDTE